MYMRRVIVSSAIFTVITGLLTIFVPNIKTVFSFVGGLGCVAISYVMPFLAFLCACPGKKSIIYPSIVLCSLLVALGFGSAIVALIGV